MNALDFTYDLIPFDDLVSYDYHLDVYLTGWTDSKSGTHSLDIPLWVLSYTVLPSGEWDRGSWVTMAEIAEAVPMSLSGDAINHAIDEFLDTIPQRFPPLLIAPWYTPIDYERMVADVMAEDGLPRDEAITYLGFDSVLPE